jgi:signal recognition particle GTPase
MEKSMNQIKLTVMKATQVAANAVEVKSKVNTLPPKKRIELGDEEPESRRVNFGCIKKKPEIVLIRGLPGSGKTTMAKKMVDHKHFEADIFLEIDGVYVYDASKVKAAHDLCLASAKAALIMGQNVVVSNTFISLWELQRYIDLGFDFRIIEANGNWQNDHGVSQDKIEMMKLRWECLPKRLTPSSH